MALAVSDAAGGLPPVGDALFVADFVASVPPLEVDDAAEPLEPAAAPDVPVVLEGAAAPLVAAALTARAVVERLEVDVMVMSVGHPFETDRSTASSSN